ncbi:hypothetical protein R77560_03802 [Ralstonia thomasii]|jgi:hypothetical protein|uniref:Transmembrane protein n=2 Tax=Ralstonia TaxID=48736 RepID=A0AAD2BSN3_9RALS|nr:hypothetical protein R77560_03802 [Ralstonia sp. LMG 18095]
MNNEWEIMDLVGAVLGLAVCAAIVWVAGQFICFGCL